MSFIEKFKAILHRPVDISDRFILLREAISGTMSEFYVAKDIKTDHIVGLKILDPKRTQQFEARFKGLNKPTEGEIASQLSHQRIVRTLEHGMTTKGQQYIVMEFLEGPGLHSLIFEKSKHLNNQRLKLIRQMAESIAAVHAAGFIHRDICPRNFICAPKGDSLRLIDFGLTVPALKEFMRPGNRTGTPNYMAPEIIRRRSTDHRIDLFSMGVTAYQLFTFELPWPGGDNTGMAALMHDTREPVAITERCPTIDPTLATAITNCFASNPDVRPDSASEFLASIRHVHSDYGE